ADGASTTAPTTPDASPPPAPTPSGWHYQRQMALVNASDARHGDYYVTSANNDPGRGAQALQGMPVDGRKVNHLEVSLWVKGTNVRPGPAEDQQAVLGITFYDDNRAAVGSKWVGPWRDSF